MVKKRTITEIPHSLRILRAVENYYGGREELARILGIRSASISHWYEEKRVSARQVLKISKLTGGRVTVGELLGEFDHCNGPKVETQYIAKINQVEG